MTMPRQAIDGFLAGCAERPVLAPFVERLAARIAGTSYQAMCADAGGWTAALSKTANLLRLDGVIVGADGTLLAEALGASIAWHDDRPHISAPPTAIANEPAAQGRLKVAIETASRLFQVIRGTHGCIAAMTGPLTLAAQIYGEAGLIDGLSALKPALVSIAEAYCKTRPDILLLIETQSIATAAGDARLRRALSAIRNVASYYDVRLGLYVASYALDDLPALTALNADLYVLGADTDLSATAITTLSQTASGLGLALPMDNGGRADPLMQDALGAQTPGSGLLLTSAGEITADADIEQLRGFLDQLREMQEKKKETSVGI